MKKVNEVFFGEHGLTSTSANHLANIAQEKVVSNEAKLKNLNFVTTTVDIVGSPSVSGKVISRGYTDEELSEVRGLLEEIAEMNAFCAWMREAVKAKDAELNAVTEKPFDEWCEENGIKLEHPERGEFATNDDALAEMNVKERNEYFWLEAVAATIGKYIHKDGRFSMAREELHNSTVKPFSTEGKGKDTLIYAYVPSVEQQKVDNLFFELQKWHRSNEQQLNHIKYDMKRKVAKMNLEKNQEYGTACEEYNIRFRELDTQFKKWKIEESERIAKLKIVVPQGLQKTYDTLSELEK